MTIVISTHAMQIYTSKICKKFHATPEETALLKQGINNNFQFACGRFDGARDSRHLIRCIKQSNGIIPGILKDRPGIFHLNDKRTVQQRHTIVSFLNEKGLAELSKDLTSYGQEENKGFLIVDAPAITRFLKGLQKQLVNSKFRDQFAKLLRED